jgi:hypothetical protein
VRTPPPGIAITPPELTPASNSRYKS